MQCHCKSRNLRHEFAAQHGKLVREGHAVLTTKNGPSRPWLNGATRTQISSPKRFSLESYLDILQPTSNNLLIDDSSHLEISSVNEPCVLVYTFSKSHPSDEMQTLVLGKLSKFIQCRNFIHTQMQVREHNSLNVPAVSLVFTSVDWDKATLPLSKPSCSPKTERRDFHSKSQPCSSNCSVSLT